MCRIFGFRSVLQSGVHSSLIDADNAIAKQSKLHPDGWGVAYYKLGSPHVIKMDTPAGESNVFKKVSGVVSAGTVVAHIRKSTVGSIGPLNTHPFQYGRWVFAHNGNLMNFPKIAGPLAEKVHPDLKPFVFGTTDSEVLFYYLLTIFKSHGFLQKFDVDDIIIKDMLQEYVEQVSALAGKVTESQGDYDKNYLTFILTDGEFMLGLQGGQPLRYSTHKQKCPERDSCAFFNPICEKQASPADQVNHLILSSEVIQNENTWHDMSFGEYVGVHPGLKLFKGQIKF